MTQEEWRQRFKSRLSELLNRRSMNQTDLARSSGLSVSRISDYMNMKTTPTIFAIINIAYALDTSISELIDFDRRIQH